MNRLLGLIQSRGETLDLVQAEGAVEACAAGTVEVQTAPGQSDGVRALLADRNRLLGNGASRGVGVFDFRYGPFTGGYPEAGIFHLHTYGERILSMEIDLAYKHRAIEASMAGATIEEGLRWAEAVCGNFAFAHSLAYCRAVESALGIAVGRADQRLRLIGLELERIYNHILVKARLAQAAAQKVLDAHLNGLFEEALRINRLFAGSRLLAGANRIGGIARAVDGAGAMAAGGVPAGAIAAGGARGRAANGSAGVPVAGGSFAAAEAAESLARGVPELRSRFSRLYESSLSSRNYLDRLHLIAVVDPEIALTYSLTGPSLRASGVAVDLRASEPLLEGFAPITKIEGDALARMELRAEEVLQSCDIILAQLAALKGESGAESLAETARGGVELRAGVGAAARASGAGVGAAESPSGTIAWRVEVEEGRIRSAYVSTPSFFGFRVFAEAITGHIFTDFPFALDSFGLSFADAAR